MEGGHPQLRIGHSSWSRRTWRISTSAFDREPQARLQLERSMPVCRSRLHSLRSQHYNINGLSWTGHQTLASPCRSCHYRERRPAPRLRHRTVGDRPRITARLHLWLQQQVRRCHSQKLESARQDGEIPGPRRCTRRSLRRIGHYRLFCLHRGTTSRIHPRAGYRQSYRFIDPSWKTSTSTTRGPFGGQAHTRRTYWMNMRMKRKKRPRSTRSNSSSRHF